MNRSLMKSAPLSIAKYLPSRWKSRVQLIAEEKPKISDDGEKNLDNILAKKMLEFQPNACELCILITVIVY
jgi:hypothetical protein